MNQLIGAQVNVLDHGSVTLLDVMGDDAAIDAAARVSFTGGAEEERTLEDRRALLRFLMRHRHTTPFEMVEFKFRVVCPIFVWRQVIRHRTASVNEISGRYAPLPDLYYCPERDRIQPQSASNKQGSENVVMADAAELRKTIADEHLLARGCYEGRLDAGMARELARINVPVSQYTAAVWKIDLHNLLHFLALRLDAHAQYETRVFAAAMADMVKQVCPLAWEAFEDFRLGSMALTARDIHALAEIGMTQMEATGYIAQIEAAVAEVKLARKQKREPDEALAAPASFWPTTREAEEFATKLHKLFVGGDRPEYTVASTRKHQRVLVCDEKHEAKYWAAATNDELHASALAILEDRIDNWYGAETISQAQQYVFNRDGAGVWKFLRSRTDWEHEHVNLVSLNVG